MIFFFHFRIGQTRASNLHIVSWTIGSRSVNHGSTEENRIENGTTHPTIGKVTSREGQNLSKGKTTIYFLRSFGAKSFSSPNALFLVKYVPSHFQTNSYDCKRQLKCVAKRPSPWPYIMTFIDQIFFTLT